MTVVSSLSPISLTQFFYASGQLVRPARLFFYAPQTEDRVVVYTDPLLSVPHDQPVLSGGSGRCPPIYVGEEPYRVRIYDSYGALIEDIDYLPGAVPPTEEGEGSVLTPEEQQQLLQPGDFVFAYTANGNARNGFVRANGKVIGPVGHSGSAGADIERLNADCQALFTHLWGNDPTGLLPVIGGRGASAADDWAANKAITLPDMIGRTLRGADPMGAVLKNRLLGADFASGDLGKVGSYGGATTKVLTLAQLPTHNHTVSSETITVTIGNNTTAGYSIANSAAVNVGNAGTGISGTVSHAHYVPGTAFTLYAGYVPPGGTPETRYSVGGVSNPAATSTETPAVSISDPGHAHAQAIHSHTLTDLTHVHSATASAHAHTLTAAGESAAVPTVGPFMLCSVYIKL